jgi:hypothetical protein
MSHVEDHVACRAVIMQPRTPRIGRTQAPIEPKERPLVFFHGKKPYNISQGARHDVLVEEKKFVSPSRSKETAGRTRRRARVRAKTMRPPLRISPINPNTCILVQNSNRPHTNPRLFFIQRLSLYQFEYTTNKKNIIFFG